MAGCCFSYVDPNFRACRCILITMAGRIKLMWVIFGTVGALIIGLLVSHSYYKSPPSHPREASPAIPSTILSSPGVEHVDRVDHPTNDVLHELYENLTIHTDSTEQLTPSTKVEVEEEDPRLRIFEEL